MIPIEVLKKYEMAEKENYLTELDFYKTFLQQTDHIPIKIIESQALGNEPKGYTEILTYRQHARNEINRLSAK